MRLLTLLMVSCFVYAAAPSQLTIGETLPPLRGEDLTGAKVELPSASQGRFAFLAIGFTYDSRWAVEAWTKRFREEFEHDAAVTFYEIPMIGGFAKLGKWFIDSGMRRGTPKSDHPHVITLYSDAGEWKARLGYRDAKAAYLVLLDRNGKIAWRYSGAFDPAIYTGLSAKIGELRESD